MKNLRKTTVALLASAFILTSCGGTKISDDEGVAQLQAMSAHIQETYDFDDKIPEELSKLYLTITADGIAEGEKAKSTGEMYFNMAEGQAYMFSKTKTTIGSETTIEETYAVQTGEDEYTGWSVKNGETKISESSSAALGLALGYAMMLAVSMPDFLLEYIEDGATPTSFVKRGEYDLDASIEITNEPNEDNQVVKETYSASYKDCFAKKVTINQYLEDGSVYLSETLNYTFGKTMAKPTIPTVA